MNFSHKLVLSTLQKFWWFLELFSEFVNYFVVFIQDKHGTFLVGLARQHLSEQVD